MNMLFKPQFGILCVLLIASLATISLADPDAKPLKNDEIKKQGTLLIESFSKDLQANLKKAIKEGGLPNGINACALQAPEIASNYSQQGWQVKRTSLKVRNPANAPTAEEMDVLEIFESGKAGGKAISDLTYYRVTETETQRVHHLMQAISTQPLCLGCHGAILASEVQSVLNDVYPDDQATGFKEGDIRGAFSLFYIETLSSSETK